MQVILLYLFFLIAQSCGFAQETSIHYSEDNNLLEADVKKFRFVEENQVPNNESIDNKTVNVEDLQRQLRAEKAKNRDLNQTISDILDRLADVEKNIIRNEEKITENQSSVVLLTRDVEDLQEEVDVVQSDVAAVQGDVAAVQGDVATVQDDVAAVKDDIVTVAVDVEKNTANITKVFTDIVSLSSSDQQQTMQIESLTSSDQQQTSMIESLSTRGTWCSFKAGPWSTSNSIITYDHLTFSDSNMNITDVTPLDINSGNYSHNC